MQQLSADGFAGAALEQHVVGQHHGGAPVHGQQGLDVLHKVQLLVGRGGPKVVALDHVLFGAALAISPFYLCAALLAKRRVGQHHLVALAGIGCQCIHHLHRHMLFAADAMQQQVHGAHACGGLHQLVAGERLFLQEALLFTRQVGLPLDDVVEGREQEAARATGWIAHLLGGLGRHAVHHGLDQRARREVLAGATLGVLRVLFQQTFVGIALHIHTQCRPVLGVDQVHHQAAQLGWILKLVLGLAEDQTQRALVLPQRFERVAVVVEELIAILGQQRGPGIGAGDDAGLAVRRLRALVGHFQEQQVSELLDIVAVAHAVIAQDVAVVPEFLDQGGGVHGVLRRA